jgi:hypothetical protein
MNYMVAAIIAVVLLLILIRLRSNSGVLLSSARPTSDRRSGVERRQRSIRVPIERRRDDRRMEDAAANFVAGLTSARS